MVRSKSSQARHWHPCAAKSLRRRALAVSPQLPLSPLPFSFFIFAAAVLRAWPPPCLTHPLIYRRGGGSVSGRRPDAAAELGLRGRPRRLRGRAAGRLRGPPPPPAARVVHSRAASLARAQPSVQGGLARGGFQTRRAPPNHGPAAGRERVGDVARVGSPSFCAAAAGMGVLVSFARAAFFSPAAAAAACCCCFLWQFLLNPPFSLSF